MKNICVFAGSGGGRLPEYAAAAAGLGRLLAESRITLVYGGGSTGLMGAVADGALKAGGKVTGVIPTDLTGIELDELFEALCWAQLGFHAKPCGLLNIKGYYDPLLKLVKNAVDECFVKEADAARLLVGAEPCELLAAILAYK